MPHEVLTAILVGVAREDDVIVAHAAVRIRKGGEHRLGDGDWRLETGMDWIHRQEGRLDDGASRRRVVLSSACRQTSDALRFFGVFLLRLLCVMSLT